MSINFNFKPHLLLQKVHEMHRIVCHEVYQWSLVLVFFLWTLQKIICSLEFCFSLHKILKLNIWSFFYSVDSGTTNSSIWLYFHFVCTLFDFILAYFVVIFLKTFSKNKQITSVNRSNATADIFSCFSVFLSLHLCESATPLWK